MAWREAGLDVVVSLREPEESEQLVLESEAVAAAASGIAFRPFHIPERGTPGSKKAVAELAGAVVDALKEGRAVAVHCRQGIGRSGLIAGAVLMAAGVGIASALSIISEARGLDVPETDEQRRWLGGFAIWFSSQTLREGASSDAQTFQPDMRLLQSGVELLHSGAMDKRLERSNKGKVLRRVAPLLAELGFRRTKPTFFTRLSSLVIEFVHVHKYSSGPEFRVHLGLSATNDTFEAAALNGPDSHPYVCEGRFELSFDESDEGVGRCAGEIARFVREVAEPWFIDWRDIGRLLNEDNSPLGTDEREYLRSLGLAVESSSKGGK
jgi:hypothetical protein